MARSAADSKSPRLAEEEEWKSKWIIEPQAEYNIDRTRSIRSRSPSPEPQSSRVEKRRRPGSSAPTAPGLRPFPVIETIFQFDQLSRPEYNRLISGERVSPTTYRTVIHTPKPHNIGKTRRPRSRSNTTASNSSTNSSAHENSSGSSNRSRSSSLLSENDTSSSHSSPCISGRQSPTGFGDICSSIKVTTETSTTASSTPAPSPTFVHQFSAFPRLTPTPERRPISAASSVYSTTASAAGDEGCGEEGFLSASPPETPSSLACSFYSAASVQSGTGSEEGGFGGVPLPPIIVQEEPTDDGEDGHAVDSTEQLTGFGSPPPSPLPPQQSIEPESGSVSVWESDSSSGTGSAPHSAYPSPPSSPLPHLAAPALTATPVSQSPSPLALPPLTRSATLDPLLTTSPSYPSSSSSHLPRPRSTTTPLPHSLPPWSSLGSPALDPPEDEDEDCDMGYGMNGGTVILGAAGVAVSRRLLVREMEWEWDVDGERSEEERGGRDRDMCFCGLSRARRFGFGELGVIEEEQEGSGGER